jgi:hypothetical protein
VTTACFHDFELGSQNGSANVGGARDGTPYVATTEPSRLMNAEQEAQGRHGLRRRHRFEIVKLSRGLSGHLRMEIRVHLQTLA